MKNITKSNLAIPAVKLFPRFMLLFFLFGYLSSIYGQAIQVDSSDSDGVFVKNIKYNGVRIDNAGTGVYVQNSKGYGIDVYNPGNDGINVYSSAHNGISVTASDGYGFFVEGNKSASTLEGHIGLIRNESPDTNADVLALQVGNLGYIKPNNNFITFYMGNGAIVGQIEGNGSGGVQYNTGGMDYAEYLPVLNKSEVFGAGDIVGVFHGAISHQTRGSDQVMVVTGQAAVVGAVPISRNSDVETEGYEIVSFIGQVLTKVNGPVQAGDWIVPSGLNDGIGRPIKPQELSLQHQIVGRAWESSNKLGVHKINVAVGTGEQAALIQIIREQQSLNDQLYRKVESLSREMAYFKELLQ